MDKIQSIWSEPVTTDTFNQRGEHSLSAYFEIQFTEVGDNYLTATMPVDERVHQPIGIMHGGISCMLAETVGSMAAQFCVNTKTHHCVGLDINTNHIRSIRKGVVTAKATPFHLGGSTQVWSIEIRDEKDQIISVTRLTMAVLEWR